MNKTAQEVFQKELIKTITADNKEKLLDGLYNLAKLSDVLDKVGSTSDADMIDKIIKEATDKTAGFWDAIMGGGAGGFSSLWSFVTGKKQDIIDIAIKIVGGAAVGWLTGALLEKLEDIPVLNWLLKIPGFQTLFQGAAVAAFEANEEAIRKLVTSFVDNLFTKAEEMLGIKAKESAPQLAGAKQPASSATAPATVAPGAQ
jgi:hypothetical protein